MSEERLKYALAYEAIGWSVIPLNREKRPYLKAWGPYQTRRANQSEIKAWWQQWPQANVGIVTGAISGLVVVDVDSMLGREALSAELGALPQTISQETGKEGGLHLFFAHPGNGTKYSNMVRAIQDVDVRGDGGYVMVAPSIHPSGREYRWVIDPVEMGLNDLLPIPTELKSLLKAEEKKSQTSKNDPGWVVEALLGVEEGRRNDMAAKLAGYFFHRQDMSYAAVEQAMSTWNERNAPPMDWKELKAVIASIANRQGRTTMGDALGEGAASGSTTQIARLERLLYPDGTVKYNVLVQGVDGYIQMDGQSLGTFTIFKWRFMDLKKFIPAHIKQKDWEPLVNAALDEAIDIVVPEDETSLGAVSGVISNIINNNAYDDDPKNIETRMIIQQKEGNEWVIALKIPMIIAMLKTESEKLTRKSVGELLRVLGFKNSPIRFMTDSGRGGRTFRCWWTPLLKWASKYEVDISRIIPDGKVDIEL